MSMRWVPHIIECAKLGGNILREMFKRKVGMDMKGAHDIVTEADKSAEAIIIECLQEKFPEHKIISEERGVLGPENAEYVWYIDPLDGTTNFYHHIPYFNISIALEYKGELIAGVVYNPLLEEMFYAEEGEGAFLNGEKIKPSDNPELSRSFITCCHGRAESEIKKFLDLMDVFKYEALDMRKLGSAGLEICYVACGRVGAFIGYGIKPWDFKAGLVIAQEAGCKVGGIEKEEMEEKNLLVSSQALYPKIREKIKTQI